MHGADNFSEVAREYQRFRPTFPEALFDYLAEISPRREQAWDCGCGNGQAALALAERFKTVIATDLSAKQIEEAPPHPRVSYKVAPAEDSGLPAGAFDLVAVAQAVHWFDFERFYAEVRRVARPGAAVAVIGYGLLRIDPALDAIIGRYCEEILGSFWPPERRFMDEEYRAIPFPFPEIEPPPLEITRQWDFADLIGFLSTWSAATRYKNEKGADPLLLILADLQQAWGAAQKTVCWPVFLRVGHVNGSV